MTTESVGVFGVLCGQKTKEDVVRKTATGRCTRAVCNRWAQHDGLHRQTAGRTFEVLYEWPGSESGVPDWKEAKRQEMAIAKKGSK